MVSKSKSLVRERYLGIELSGARNPKTAISTLEFYPRENKTFLLEIHERIGLSEKLSGEEGSGPTPADQQLLDRIEEWGGTDSTLAVNVPLTLPPCLLPAKLEAKAVDWMLRFSRKSARAGARGRVEFTAYTQRPVELWIRHQILPQFPPLLRFEVDEALGGSRAPLTARMHFLKRKLRAQRIVEVWPKLSTLALGLDLGIDRRVLSRYRKLEEGAQARQAILETLSARRNIFIYEPDLRKLSHNLAAFDSFICAYTALLSRQGACEPAPRGFPLDSGWVEFPRLR